MNCDTAFDLMTDSHGSRSGALAVHFESCPRCRRMQEALSPALDFLSGDGAFDRAGSRSPDFSAGSAVREPFVSTEAVQVARQAATDLALRTELLRVHMARVAVRTGKYAAAFAAGLLLAVVLFNEQDRSTRRAGASCTRHEASTDVSSRTPNQIQALAQSCALCHSPSSIRADDHSQLVPASGERSWDWLRRILEDQPESAVELPRIETGPMIAGVNDKLRATSEHA